MIRRQLASRFARGRPIFMGVPEVEVGFWEGDDVDLAAEIASATRSAALLWEAGVRVSFARRFPGGITIELRRSSGERIREISARELIQVTGMDITELTAWLEATRGA